MSPLAAQAATDTFEDVHLSGREDGQIELANAGGRHPTLYLNAVDLSGTKG